MVTTYLANLQADTQTSYANNGKTTMLGRVFQKTLSSLSVIGPPLTQFIDVQTLAGFIPTYTYFNPSTNRLYVLGPVSATPTIALFNFDNNTGAYSYVGKITMALGNAAATTYVFRGFRVYESGGLIYPIISVTGSVVINGGTYVGWGLSASDFTFGGTPLFSANASNQKAVYFLQDPSAVGVSNVATTSWGVALPQFSPTSGINTKAYQFNGTLAAPVIYSWDLAGTPTVLGTVTSGVSSQTTLFASTTPSAFFTMTSRNNYLSGNEQVVLMNGSGNVPTAFTAWTAGTAQVAASNVYFMRDFQQLYTFTCTALTTGISAGSTYTNNGFTFTVLTAAAASATTFVASVVPPGAPLASGTLTRTAGTGDATITFSSNTAGNYFFNLATTAAGATVTPTSTTSNFTMMRAFGISTSLFSFKTGTLPALTLGTILQNQSVGYAKPTNAPANSALNGEDCLYVASTTGLYMGKISDLTSLGTTWPSMITTGINITGTGIDITAPTILSASYSGQNQSNAIDKWVYVTSASTYVVKPYQASTISAVFGGQSNLYLETLNLTTNQVGVLTPAAIDLMNGWMFVCSSATGQRGIIFCDMNSDSSLSDAAQIISPVINVPVGSTLKYVDALEQLFNNTNSLNIFIRSAATNNDSVFSSSTGGWVQVEQARDLTGTAVGPYFQFKATFDLVTNNSSTPAQINDFIYSVVLGNELSDNWVGSVNNTTQNGGSPSYSAFRLVSTYASSVPTMYFRAYDDSGNLVASANTTTNPTLFQYSTNNGTSWNSLGTIPNTALTTEVRYLWSSPPGVNVTVSFRES